MNGRTDHTQIACWNNKLLEPPRLPLPSQPSISTFPPLSPPLLIFLASASHTSYASRLWVVTRPAVSSPAQLAGRGHVSYEPYSSAQRTDLRTKVVAYLGGEIPELEASTLRQVTETFEIFRALYREQAQALQAATERASAAAVPGAPGMPSGGMEGAVGGGGVSLLAEAEEAPRVEVVDLVGEVADGGGASGFGCGVAPADARPPHDPQLTAAAAQPSSMPAAAMINGGSAAMGAGEASMATGAAMAMGSVSGVGAPGKHEAEFFAEFKEGAGAEVAALLVQNKNTLREHKNAARGYAHEVNRAKEEIDALKQEVDTRRKTRPSDGRADVIDGEEFELLSRLRGAKAKYRQSFAQLSDERSSVDYATGLVENCRAQLLADFSAWLVMEHPEAAGGATALAAAAAAANDGAALQQPSYASSIGAFTGGGRLGSGFDAGYGGSSSLLLGRGSGSLKGADPAAAMHSARLATPMDQDEQFEAMAKGMILDKDPDALPFFNASCAPLPAPAPTRPRPCPPCPCPHGAVAHAYACTYRGTCERVPASNCLRPDCPLSKADWGVPCCADVLAPPESSPTPEARRSKKRASTECAPSRVHSNSERSPAYRDHAHGAALEKAGRALYLYPTGASPVCHGLMWCVSSAEATGCMRSGVSDSVSTERCAPQLYLRRLRHLERCSCALWV